MIPKQIEEILNQFKADTTLSPREQLLFKLVEYLLQENQELKKEIQQLRDEINRLKGESGQTISASSWKNGIPLPRKKPIEHP